MKQEILQSIDGVTIYPMFSLFVFVLFFLIVIIWMFRVDKNYLKKMANLPLEKEGDTNFNNTGDLYEKKI